MPDYHLIGTYTRYSSMSSVCPLHTQVHQLTAAGWTARVETVLEYFEIPYTSKMLTFDEVPHYTTTLSQLSQPSQPSQF